MIRFHALVTHLYTELGHRYVYQICFRKAVLALKIPYKGYANKAPSIQDLPHDWEPCLKWKDENRILQVFMRSFCLSRIFRRKPQEDETRIFFLDSPWLADLAALTLSLLLFSKKQDRIWLLFRYELKSKLYSHMLRLLQKKMGHRLIFLTDSDRVAQTFEESLNQRTFVLPIPHTDIPILPSKPAKTCTLWWPGRPDLEKGADKIQTLARLSGNVEIYLSEDGKKWIENAQGHCKFLKPILSREEYLEQFGRSDAILLPYNPTAYYARTSGIFVEAVFAGKFPFVVDGSWLAHELNKHNLPELILDWERPDLLGHMIKILKDQNVKAKFNTMQKAYLTYHSLPSYAKELQQILKYSQIGCT